MKSGRSWKNRWFELHDNIFSYYKKTTGTRPRGVLTLTYDSTIKPVAADEDHPYCFEARGQLRHRCCVTGSLCSLSAPRVWMCVMFAAGLLETDPRGLGARVHTPLADPAQIMTPTAILVASAENKDDFELWLQHVRLSARAPSRCCARATTTNTSGS